MKNLGKKTAYKSVGRKLVPVIVDRCEFLESEGCFMQCTRCEPEERIVACPAIVPPNKD